LEFYGDSSLKQQSVERHVAPRGHIILLPSQPIIASLRSYRVSSIHKHEMAFLTFTSDKINYNKALTF